jgi:tetratricopeptide (TPR) repeat protein
VGRSILALALHDLGDLAGARVQLKRALAIGEAALGPDHPNVAIWRASLGNVLWALGDLQGARVQLERALAIGEAALEPNHPTVATIRGNLDRVRGALRETPGEDPGRSSRHIGEHWRIQMFYLSGYLDSAAIGSPVPLECVKGNDLG